MRWRAIYRDPEFWIVASATLVACWVLTAAADAAERYVGLEVQANFPLNEDQSDAIEAGSEGVPGIAGTVGVSVNAVMALEAQVGWRRSRLHGCNPPECNGYHSSDGRVDIWYGMANARLQAPTPYVQPYIIGGIGGGYQRVDGRASSGRKLNGAGFEIAHHYGAGIRIPVGRVTFDIGGRRFEAGDVQHMSAIAGLTWSFGR